MKSVNSIVQCSGLDPCASNPQVQVSKSFARVENRPNTRSLITNRFRLVVEYLFSLRVVLCLGVTEE